MKSINSRRTSVYLAMQLLFASTATMATDYTSTQTADGNHADLADSTVTTTGDLGIGLQALNGGSFSASHVNVTTHGDQAYGLYALGANSVIDLSNGSITTTGVTESQAARASGGGTINLTGVTIHTTGTNNGIGIMAIGAGSTINVYGGQIDADGSTAVLGYNGGSIAVGRDANGNGTVINASAPGGKGARADGGTVTIDGATINVTGTAPPSGSVQSGVSAITNGTLTATDTTIHVTQDQGTGTAAGDGGTVSLNNVSITTAGKNGYGLVGYSQSTTTAAHTTISTQGQAAYGAIVSGANASITILDSEITTSGQGAWGAAAGGAGQLEVTGTSITTAGNGSHGVVSTDMASVVQASDVNIQSSGFNAVGALARNGGVLNVGDSGILTTGDSSYGVEAQEAGSAVKVSNTRIQTGGANAHGAMADSDATVSLQDSSIATKGAGAYAAASVDGTLTASGTSLLSDQFTALHLDHAVIALSDGTQAKGGNGQLADLASDAANTLSMNNQVVAEGDIRFGAGPTDSDGNGALDKTLVVSLDNQSSWRGATDAIGALDISSGSAWMMTGDSHIKTVGLNDSLIAFTAPDSGAYKTLTVGDDLSGTGGGVQMNTLLNEGGALSNQHTDRLLVGGNVTTTGTIYLDVVPQGNGGLTDTNKNGVVEADEGISLVQVAGQSRADAFAVKGGYVAAGPYQYTLYAFGPGQTDASQNMLSSGDLNWDYRLGNKFVNEEGPIDPPIDPPVDPSGGRPAVVPQVPSYIAAPTALFNYGNMVIDTLHQRLGELRQVPSDDEGQHGGELFVRYIGSQQQYATDRGFANYGYDFDQQINAMQLGGNLVTWTGDKSTLRAGWALDKGTTRVSPKAVDGFSSGKYDAHGVSAWLTWQQDNGFYVDAVIGGERYKGDISTEARGGVGSIRASSWNASVEMGYPIAVGGGWSVEPQAQLKYQHLSFARIQDADDLATSITPSGQTTTRLGARFVKTDNARFAPYARFDVLRTIGGAAKVTTSSQAWDISDTFEVGRVGTGYRAGVGLTSALTKHLSVYGEGDYLHGASDHGFKGWSGNVGLRLNF